MWCCSCAFRSAPISTRTRRSCFTSDCLGIGPTADGRGCAERELAPSHAAAAPSHAAAIDTPCRRGAIPRRCDRYGVASRPSHTSQTLARSSCSPMFPQSNADGLPAAAAPRVRSSGHVESKHGEGRTRRRTAVEICASVDAALWRVVASQGVPSRGGDRRMKAGSKTRERVPAICVFEPRVQRAAALSRLRLVRAHRHRHEDGRSQHGRSGHCRRASSAHLGHFSGVVMAPSPDRRSRAVRLLLQARPAREAIRERRVDLSTPRLLHSLAAT
jgi:hypothetical protein